MLDTAPPRLLMVELPRAPFATEEITVRVPPPPATSAIGASERLNPDEVRTEPELLEDPVRTIARHTHASGDGWLARPSLLGSRTDEVAVLVDGVELPDAFHLSELGGPLSIVPGDTILSTEVSSFSPASQGGRMGGTIELLTRTAETSQRSFGLSLVQASTSSRTCSTR